eukprot:scaffold11346_cov50-Phaeocystis_antarctica.AAC.1
MRSSQRTHIFALASAWCVGGTRVVCVYGLYDAVVCDGRGEGKGSSITPCAPEGRTRTTHLSLHLTALARPCCHGRFRERSPMIRERVPTRRAAPPIRAQLATVSVGGGFPAPSSQRIKPLKSGWGTSDP